MKSNPMPRGFRFAAQARASAWLASLGLLSAFAPQAAQAQAVIDNSICQTLATYGCTANDVPVANVKAVIVDPNTGLPLADQTCVAGQTVSVKMTADTLSGASKYDIGMVFSAQNVCQGLFLDQAAPGDPSPPSNDICGDATTNNTAVPLHPVSGGAFPNATPSNDVINIPCQADSSGNLVITDAVVSWHTPGDNQVCNGQPATYLVPNQQSKCRVQSLPLGTGVRGTITVIKQTLPDGLPDSFAFTAAAASGNLGDAANDAAFNLVDNGTHVIETAPLTGTANNHTIDENLSPAQIAAGWVTSSIACVYSGTATPVANATVNLANGTAVLPMIGNQPHITCTYTNTRPPQLHLKKALGGNGRANAADQFTMNIGATTATTAGSGATVTGGQVDIVGTAGQSHAFGEVMAGGSVSVLGQYDSAYACTNATAGSATVMPAGAGSSFNLTPAAGDDITCTITNTPKAATVVLRKALDALGRAFATDQFAMTITGTGGSTVNTGGSGSTVTGGVVTVNPATLGQGYTLSEAMAAGSDSPLSNYTSSIACTNGRAGAPATTLPSGAGTSFNVTPQAGDSIDCTITNVRKTGTVTVVKDLVPNADPGLFNLQINGNTVATNVGDNGSGSTPNVPAGSTVNVAELAGTGTSLANYTSSLSCTGATAIGTTSGSFTMPAGNVTCTFTNTRKTHSVRVQKSLSPGNDSGVFNLAVTGAVSGSVSNVGNGGFVDVNNVPVGGQVNVAETAGTNTSLANYGSVLSCTGVAGVTGTTSGGFTMPDADVVCTFTNTRKSAQLILRKTWQNAKVGDAVTITGTGSANALSLDAVAGAANETDAANAVTVYAGETISLSESFTTGVSADYAQTLACTGAADGNPNDGLNIGPNDTAITCTYTNARNSSTVTVIKALNPTTDAGKFDLSINGNVVASAVGNAGQGAAPVLIGDQVTVAEVAANGTTGANYTSSLSCTGVAGVTGTTSGSFAMPAGNVVCTFTNTRKTHTLRVQKALLPANDAGQFVMNANGTDGVAGGDGAFSTAVVAVGAPATFGETAAQGTSLANYTSSYSCTDDTSGQGTSGSIASMPDADVTCTITNTRKSARLTLVKTWQNAKVGDAVTIAGTGSVNALSLDAVAGAANETDTGSAVNVYAGETISFSETFTTGVDADYTKTLACTGAADGNVNDGLAIGPNDTEITCTYTNARNSGTVTVMKALSPSSDTGRFDLSINGNVVAAAVGDGGTSAAVPMLIGDQVTVAEAAANGTTGTNYTSSLSCTGVNGVTGTTSGSFTMPSGNVVCTFTNTRKTHTLRVQKALLPANDAGQFVMNANGTDGVAGGDGAFSTAVVAVGAPATFGETAAQGTSLANYTSSYSCTDDTSGQGTSGSIASMPDADVTCTITNTRKSARLTLVKTWQNAKVGDAVTIAGTGSVNALSLDAVAGAANETDTGSAVNVYAGETISFSETFTTGVDADYTKTLACTGAADGNANDGLAIGPNDTEITCTYTNARNSGTVTVMKALSPSSDTGRFDLSINGNVVAAAVGDGGTSAAVPMLIGDQVTVAEAAANGTTGTNYTSSLSCTGVNGVTGTTSGSFTMPSGNVVCTFTNTRNPGRLTLVKQLVGRVAAADQFTVSVNDGEGAVASATTTGTDTSATTGATSLAPGAYTLIDAPAQANPSPADYYAASLACTNATEGSATVLPSGNGTSFPLTLQSGDDITCTFTNTPIPPEVTVGKVLSAGGPTATPGETLTYTITLTNSGGAAATNHAFFESIPAYTSFVSVSGASVSGCVAGDAGRKTCTLTVAGPIAGNGGTANVTLQVKVADTLPAGLLNLYNLVTDNTSTPPPAACNPATDSNQCRTAPPTCNVAEDPLHCVATPIAPIFTVLKEVTGPATPGQTEFSYVVNYRITVTNQGGSSGTYDLTDTPKFGAGTTITGISAQRGGSNVAGLSGTGPWTLADDQALAAGAQDVYTLSVTVQVAPGAPLPSDTCVANTPNNGYFNTATLNVAAGPLESNACTNTPRPVTPVVALEIEKLGSTRVAEIGDLVSYSVRIRNTGNTAAILPVLVDRLPPGFRLIDEGTRVVGANLVSLQGAPGPVLQFTLDRVPAGAEVRVLYRVRLGVGSREGNGINTAQVECGSSASRTACSNMSQWKVEVTAGIFHDEGCIAGQVFIDCNRNSVKDPEEIGIPGVRMYMEDGTFLVSDVQGKYSLCGILPKTHVIAVDQTTLPRGSRLTTSSSRNAGDAGSLFVDLKKGELFRADFIEGSCSNGVLEQTKARQANGEVRSVETETGQPKLQFESKPATSPQEATDSANQQIEQSRHKPE